MKKIIESLILLALLVVFIFVGRIRLAAFYHNRGIDYYERGLFEEAVASFQRSLKIYPRMAVSHYSLADAYMGENLVDKAIEEYRKTIQLDPGYTEAYQALSQIYTNRQMYQEALLILKQAESIVEDRQKLERSIENISLEYMADCIYKGVDLFLSGNKQEAYDLLKKALRIKPDFAHTYYTLGYFYYSDNNYDEAGFWLDEAIKLDPQFWPAHKLLGDIYFGERNYESAIEKYKTVINSNHGDAVLLNDLGLALMEMERYSEALVYLKQALSLEPDNPNIHYSLASVYRDNKMLDEAVSEYKDLIIYHPDYPNVHNDLADIYMQLGKDKEALEEYHKEIEYAKVRLSINPDDTASLNQLAYAYNGIGEHVQAEKIIKDVIARRPGYRNAYITLAAVYEKSRRFTEALAVLDKVKQLSKYKDFVYEDIDRVKKLDTLSHAKPVSFDKIYLKNGRLFQGIIKDETEEKIILEIFVGNSRGVITLYRSDIERIVKR